MQTFEYAELRPPFGNERRDEVVSWCEKNIIDNKEDESGIVKWYTHGVYDEIGDFAVYIRGAKNEKVVTLFLLKFPNTICKVVYKSEDSEGSKVKIAKESQALFEGLFE